MYKNANKYFSRNRGLARAVTFNAGQTSNYKTCPSCNEKVLKSIFRTHLREVHPTEIFIKCEYCFRIVQEELYSKHLSRGHHNYYCKTTDDNESSDLEIFTSGEKKLPKKNKSNNKKNRLNNKDKNLNPQDKRFTVKILVKKS